MSVTIRELLYTDLFKDTRIVAGEKGIDNVFKRVNFSDCPIDDDASRENLVSTGDLFINSLYIVKDDESKMMAWIKFYTDTNSAGVFIIDEYIQKLPQVILDYANTHDFPIMFIDKDIPYAEIIKTAMEKILFEQSDILSEMHINILLDQHITSEEVVKSARIINENFSKYYCSLFFSANDITSFDISSLRNDITGNYEFKSVKFKNGFIIIMNFSKSRTVDPYISYLIDVIKGHSRNYKLGISNVFTKVEDFSRCIKQSVSSLEISSITDDKVVYYKDLNVYKILYPIRDSLYAKDFYKDIYIPLQQYDKKYNADLIGTIEIYLIHDGDYKKTALTMHQHENTVRYRILKAKKILDLEDSNIKFIEQVSIALKLHKIIRDNN